MSSFFLELGWAIACSQWKDFRGITKFSENSVSTSPSLPCIPRGPRRSQWLWVEIIRVSTGATALITRFPELEACQLPMKEVDQYPWSSLYQSFWSSVGKGDQKVGSFIALEPRRSQQSSKNGVGQPSHLTSWDPRKIIHLSSQISSESLIAEPEGSIWLLWSLEDAITKPSCWGGSPNLKVHWAFSGLSPTLPFLTWPSYPTVCIG